VNSFEALGKKPTPSSAIPFAELGEQESIQQGIKRFSVRNRAAPSSWLQSGNPGGVAEDTGNPTSLDQ
jgi:hypothetical protein